MAPSPTPDTDRVGGGDDEIALPPVTPDEELEDLEPDDGDDGEQDPGDETDDDVDDIAAQAQDTYASKRKRRKKGAKKAQDPQATAAQMASKTMDIIQWIDYIDRTVGWARAGVVCEIWRVHPQWYNQIKTEGFIDKRAGGCFEPEEIREMYGGGEYEMVCRIPPEGTKRGPRARRKRFSIIGAPKTGAATEPPKDAGPPPEKNPRTEASVVELLGRSMERAWESGGGAGADLDALRGPYESTQKVMRDNYDSTLRSQIAAHERITEEAERKADDARKERDEALRELRRQQEQTELKIREATTRNNDLVATLIPTLSENSARQVEHALKTFEAREARIETQHAKEIESLHRYHEAQIRQERTAMEAQIARVETSYQSQLGLLQQQLQHFQLTNQTLSADNTRLRDEMMQLRIGQLESLKQDNDPIAALTKLAELRDNAEGLGIFGGGKGEGGDDLEGMPTWLKAVVPLGSKLADAVTAVAQAKNGPGMAPGMMPPGLSPEQQHAFMLQQQAAAQQQQMMVPAGGPAGPPVAPPAPRAPAVKLKRADVKELMTTVQNIYTSGTPAETAAKAAIAHPDVDRSVLIALARKDPERVINELEAAQLLGDGTLSGPEGKKYIADMLGALREALGG